MTVLTNMVHYGAEKGGQKPARTEHHEHQLGQAPTRSEHHEQFRELLMML